MSDPLQCVDLLNDAQVEQLHALYQQQWWSGGRSLEGVRDMVANSSLVYALVEPGTGRLVAFCRVLTDFVFRGMLHDVIVDDAWRGRGVGRQLMEIVTSDPRLASVQAIGLWCKPELVPLYEKFGFETANAGYCWMQRGGERWE